MKSFAAILILVFLLVDLYFFQSIRVLIESWSVVNRRIALISYWLISLAVLGLVAAFLYNPRWFHGNSRQWIFTAFFAVFLPKLIGILFLLADDVRRFSFWIADLFSNGSSAVAGPSKGMSRSEFLSKGALVGAAVPFVTLSFGIISGAHNYQVRHQRVLIPNLPRAFDGLRVGQLSDIHSGSFFNKTAVSGGIDMLMNEKPDLVFFTGDLVNEESSEVDEYVDIFRKVKAPLGVFSTTGNHDYGDYQAWTSPEAKTQNFRRLIEAHEYMGWDLLMNSNRTLTQGGEKLAIIGVENWGAGRFSKYGKFEPAMQGTEDAGVRILLSHDPSSWDAMVRPNYPNVDLTLSGHTHGFQFGIEIGGFKWSPSQYIYPQWAGLYQKGDQQIYVNRGFGYLGYPGRIGILPEITILELVRS